MTEIGRYRNDEFVVIDYGSHIELSGTSGGYHLEFTDWGGLLRLADFINQRFGFIRKQQSRLTPLAPDAANACCR